MFQDFLRGAARNVGADGVDRCAAQLFAIIGGASQEVQDAGISSQMDLPLETHEAATSLISAFFAVRRRWRCAPFRSQDPDTPNRRCTPSSPPTPTPTREQTSPSSAFHACHCGRTSSPPSDATDAFLADARRRWQRCCGSTPPATPPACALRHARSRRRRRRWVAQRSGGGGGAVRPAERARGGKSPFPARGAGRGGSGAVGGGGRAGGAAGCGGCHLAQLPYTSVVPARPVRVACVNLKGCTEHRVGRDRTRADPATDSLGPVAPSFISFTAGRQAAVIFMSFRLKSRQCASGSCP
jgi:hypothetical protein